MLIRVEPDNTGYAPPSIRFYAFDDDTYDGADDSPNRNQIGYGASPIEAITALLALLEEPST